MVSSLKVSTAGSFCLLTHLSEEHCFPVEVDLMAYCHTKLFSKEKPLDVQINRLKCICT